MLEITLLSTRDLSIAIKILTAELVQFVVQGLTINFSEELDFEIEKKLVANVAILFSF